MKKKIKAFVGLLFVMVMSSYVAFAGEQSTISGQRYGIDKYFTGNVTCNYSVTLSITTSSKYASGILQCEYSNGVWKDIPGSTVSINNKSVQYSLDDLNVLLFTNKSSYECRGVLRITCPITIYLNYLTATAA